MKRELAMGNIMIDCADEREMQEFYSALLGWEKCEQWAHPGVRNGAGVLLLFAEEPDYARPVWPEEDARQQKQMHFDFQVDDLWSAVEEAERLGAVKAGAQYGDGDFITMLDPAGHPFCLCKE